MKKIQIVLLVMLLGCGPTKPTKEYVSEIENWKTSRLKDLMGEEGYVNLAGLFWLKEGENTFGGSDENDLKFPEDKTPETLGAFILQNDTVYMVTSGESGITSGGIEIGKRTPAYNGDMENTPEFNWGSLRWIVIKRGEKFGVRLRDFEHENLTNMDPIEFFDLNPEMKVVADFVPYDPPKFVKTANILGMAYDAKVPGLLKFELQGQKCEMEPNLDGDLHLRFTDETTGEETYGLGRYLHADMPDASNKVVIDFNKAYNPPCAFTEHATCPIPPKANHIAFKLLAGEKNFELH